MTVLDYMKYMGKIEDFAKKKLEEKNAKSKPPFYACKTTTDWYFLDDTTVLIEDNKYKLSKILGDIKVSVKDLNDITSGVINTISQKRCFDKSRISKIKVDSTSIRIFFEGEDVEDWRSGKIFNLKDLHNMGIFKDYTRPGNPFREYTVRDEYTGLVIKPEYIKMTIGSILSELKFQGFDLLLKQKINRDDDIDEYYYLLAHKVGVTVVLQDNSKEKYGSLKGSIFIFCKNDSNNMHSVLGGWDGGGREYRKDIYSGFTNDLKKAYDLADTEWVYGFPNNEAFTSFCIYNGAKSLEYLGGLIREEKGGKGRYIMSDDVYSSYELSMFCSYYENMVIFNKVPNRSSFVPKSVVQKKYNDIIASFKKVYPNEYYLLRECANRIDKAYGVSR